MEIIRNALENLSTGVLGGVIVGLIFAGAKLVKNKATERRHPIKGKYLSTFEDIENGELIISTALATLKQQGKKITGTTENNEGRKWNIDGELTENGHLHGVYIADDPLDKGVGNFFLKVANNRNMDGLWSGYDSENNQITSGRYSFKPILYGYQIVEATKEHITQIVALGNVELGEGFLNYQEMSNMLNDNETYLCKVAIEGKRVIGFCLCKTVSHDDLSEYLHVDEEAMPDFVRYADKVGVIKTIAVSNDFQKRGVGYTLTLASYNELSKRDVQAVASIAWKRGTRINAHGVLSAAGLRPHKIIPDYWKNDSITQKFKCPNCGEPPCNCSAVLYFCAI
jgi:ribosomal protein S18 acetylase RimI-like enzyme